VGRILIAEDDQLISSFIARGLRAHGYSVVVADDGAEAERWIASDEFDLIILDMALPYRSGFEVLQELRAQQNPIPVLVLTGRPELKDAVARLDVGADDYMTKPFHFGELLGRVRARLAQGNESAAIGSPPGT
jgi:two-component system copper resistance phosphate regulon response regulator CusR